MKLEDFTPFFQCVYQWFFLHDFTWISISWLQSLICLSNDVTVTDARFSEVPSFVFGIKICGVFNTFTSSRDSLH